MSDPVAQNPSTCAHISHSRATAIKIALLRLNSLLNSAIALLLFLPLSLPPSAHWGLVGWTSSRTPYFIHPHNFRTFRPEGSRSSSCHWKRIRPMKLPSSSNSSFIHLNLSISCSWDQEGWISSTLCWISSFIHKFSESLSRPEGSWSCSCYWIGWNKPTPILLVHSSTNISVSFCCIPETKKDESRSDYVN